MLSIIIVATVLAGIVRAQNPTAMALTPSSDWYGVDGNWSTVKFEVGTPKQSVNVLVSTSLSEFWVVGAGGCLAKEPLCNNARGNVFTFSDSKSWNSLGAWQLGLDYLGYGGNGDYGLDTLTTTTLAGKAITMDNVITASINSTDYYLGFLGLGITKGSFGNEIAESPLTQAVKNYGWIPSYSYGYTAGAYYKGTSGTPCSVTLGGYDASRFVMHNNEFSLDPSDGLPHALVRGIEVTAGQDRAVPGGWDARTRILSNMSTSFTAMIDSSTPYLWLPDTICDQFAEAFNLTYNSTFDLYTVTNEQYAAFKAGSSSFSFTFSFSSHDNNDDFGRPLQVPGVVNITITAAAFAHVLRYPFKSESIKYGDPAVPYFPLRRASNFTNTFIIGRTFLQEAYLITKYDSGVFSLHQAVFPDDSQMHLNVSDIKRPDNSPYPPPPSQEGFHGLSTAQMAGIAAGAVAACIALLVVWYCLRRRKSAACAATRALEEGKDTASTIMPEPPRSPIAKIFSRLLGKKRAKKGSRHEAMGSTSQPVEIAADANHAVYELPALGPVELNGDDNKSLHGHAEFGGAETRNLTAYDAARRKVEMQLRGPVPAYTPPANPADFPSPEKSIPDMSPIATYRPTEFESLASASSLSLPTSPISPTASTVCDNSSSNHGSMPSPMSSPQGDWTNRMSDLPSPLTDGHTYPSPTFTVSNYGHTMPRPVSMNSEAFAPSRSSSSNTAPSVPLPLLPVSPSPTYQRTPIDPSNIICVGPLQGNISLSEPQPIAPLCPQGREVHVPDLLADRRLSTDTLGSNFTEFEEQLMAQQEFSRQGNLPETHVRGHRADPSASSSQGRLDGTEWIHVPQLAERRYSWED
ncbi:eukaryotic aspartyl protease family protein [Colletotrichum truncatum]|uniref:Eukaryotic aspartyl protease family protein n=1 Tax=Colletotrichum truncatum TaxID=5467 RepID=A0ACC3ZJQ4_COLTU|nr:eukaryotic aspartyl protease family protein [Colletotrichum truncatum]KAF6799703.1 eukaryotic aspartyl protease family protein [Colletotrichum truncatum]